DPYRANHGELADMGCHASSERGERRCGDASTKRDNWIAAAIHSHLPEKKKHVDASNRETPLKDSKWQLAKNVPRIISGEIAADPRYCQQPTRTVNCLALPRSPSPIPRMGDVSAGDGSIPLCFRNSNTGPVAIAKPTFWISCPVR